MERRLLLLCLLAAAGCPAPVGDEDDSAANDDDSAANDDDSAANDDDSAADDDDATDPPCAGGALPDFDLTDPDEALDLVVLPVGLLQLSFNYVDAVLAYAEPDCPAIAGDLPGSGAASGAATVIGDGCVTALGYRYDGVLDLAWSVDGADRQHELLGQDFTMVWEGTPGQGADPLFDRTGLDGTFTFVLDDRTAGKLITVDIVGWFLASLLESAPQAGSYPAHRVAPEGWDGVWSIERLGDDADEFWTVDADVHVRCRGPLQYGWDMQAQGDCAGEPESGTVGVRAGGVDLLVDAAADTICDGCLDYTLDGALQPAPLCLPSGG